MEDIQTWARRLAESAPPFTPQQAALISAVFKGMPQPPQRSPQAHEPSLTDAAGTAAVEPSIQTAA